MTAVIEKNKKLERPPLLLEDDCQWITCSLFSPMEAWPLLLKHIHSFLEDANELYSCFRIQLNDNNGENIRLALLIQPQNKQKIGDALHLRFRPLLAGNSANGKPKKVDSIFLPYPTNVIEFDLYNLQYDGRLSDIYEAQQEISDLIIEVLKHETIDVETISTFCFYLQICLINVVLRYPVTEASVIKLISSYVPKNVHSIKTASDENINLLMQITSDVMSTVQENELSWVNRWVAFCAEASEKFIDHHNGDTEVNEMALRSFYQFFVFRIHESLGISGKSKLFLDYAVHRSISDIMKEKSAFNRNQITLQTTSDNHEI